MSSGRTRQRDIAERAERSGVIRHWQAVALAVLPDRIAIRPAAAEFAPPEHALNEDHHGWVNLPAGLH